MKLSPREREAMTYALAGETPKEIATRMGISVGTTKMHLSRARLALGFLPMESVLRWATRTGRVTISL